MLIYLTGKQSNSTINGYLHSQVHNYAPTSEAFSSESNQTETIYAKASPSPVIRQKGKSLYKSKYLFINLQAT